MCSATSEHVFVDPLLTKQICHGKLCTEIELEPPPYQAICYGTAHLLNFMMKPC